MFRHEWQPAQWGGAVWLVKHSEAFPPLRPKSSSNPPTLSPSSVNLVIQSHPLRTVVFSFPAPAFVLEDFGICYSHPLPLPYRAWTLSLWPFCPLHCSHFLPLSCLVFSWPRILNLGAFHSKVTLIVAPTKPNLKYQGLLPLLHFTGPSSPLVHPYQIWSTFLSTKTISLVASSVFLYPIPWALLLCRVLDLD